MADEKKVLTPEEIIEIIRSSENDISVIEAVELIREYGEQQRELEYGKAYGKGHADGNMDGYKTGYEVAKEEYDGNEKA